MGVCVAERLQSLSRHPAACAAQAMEEDNGFLVWNESWEGVRQAAQRDVDDAGKVFLGILTNRSDIDDLRACAQEFEGLFFANLTTGREIDPRDEDGDGDDSPKGPVHAGE